jgi:glycosyltransferase involved in cell wall biosynthesis
MIDTQKTFVVTVTTAGRGGMRSVTDRLESDGLGARHPRRTLYSHVEGSMLRRLIAAFRALTTFVWMLLRRQVGLLHCHVAMRGSFWRKGLFARAAQLAGVPVIFHLHGSETAAFYAGLPQTLKRLFSAQLEAVDRVFVLSESWREFVLAVAPAARVEVMPNYVDMPEESAIRQAHEGVRIVFLGLLGQRKGVYDLVEAFASVAGGLPDVKLLIGGNGEEDQVRAAVRSAGMESRIDVLGWVTGDTKTSLLAHGDVFVLPSYNEGLPVSLLEAMSWGLPVISTTVGGIPQLVRNEVDGLLIEAGDRGALAQSLARLGGDADLRRRMGDVARARVSGTFSKENVLPRMEAVYAELMGEGSQ